MRAFVEKRPADYMGVRRRAAEGGSSEFVWGAPQGECGACGATGIPRGFEYCGVCGASMGDAPSDAAQNGGAQATEAEGAETEAAETDGASS